MNKNDYPDQILLSGLSFHGYTGVFSFEKQVGQKFTIDLVLCFHQLAAVNSDKLTDTVHYGTVFSIVKEIVEGQRYDLIERLAGEIVHTLLEDFPLIDAVDVVVSKPEAPVEGEFEAMRVHVFRVRKSAPGAGVDLL
jgi:7,8-dihydroneopterin aldolase/epimerase/oxygenase